METLTKIDEMLADNVQVNIYTQDGEKKASVVGKMERKPKGWGFRTFALGTDPLYIIPSVQWRKSKDHRSLDFFWLHRGFSLIWFRRYEIHVKSHAANQDQ